jgi:heparan-alpha-glucosaminide N-acetyltransferase
MSAAGSVIAANQTAVATAPRIVSIDIFRGVTMAVMIFVNALSEVRGLPWWTYHAHAEQDLMTYVDMVFPFFLFIVGMSMPLSIAQRLKRNPSQAALWLHVAQRFLSLLVLGLILANAEKADSSRMAMSGNLWALLGLICCGLYLNVYPKSARFPAYSAILRCAGLAGVIALFAIFRRTTQGGQVAWIDFSYPEILGLIGFSYLAAAVLYIPTRRWKWAAAFWFVLLTLLCIGTAAKIIPVLGGLPLYVWPFSNGAMACIIMAGVVTSQIYLGVNPAMDERPAPKSAMTAALAFSAITLAAGWLCIPLGISKIRATPSWSLWCIGAAILMFTLLYWLCDRKGQVSWAVLFRPAGANTLTTYLLPDLWYYLAGLLSVTWMDSHFETGWPAVLKTVGFTVFMLLLAMLFTRAKIRLQL